MSNRKILWSDVEVKNQTKRRMAQWNSLDLATARVVLSMHILSMFALATFSWKALSTAVALYVITGLLGITLSFHRNLAHRSFKLPKWLEYLFAYCGVHALQGPMDWVSTHRYHHQYCDSDRDPHSPVDRFWFSHISWLFDTTAITQKGVRVVWVYHITWLVNSVCHVWGYRSWNTDDLSKNNWWVAMLAFGEGWHNNRHAFVYSARHGLEWWEVDMTWYVVKLLEMLGLATDVRLPSQVSRQRMSFNG